MVEVPASPAPGTAPDALTDALAPTPLTTAVLETALGLRGTPYQFGGVVPETGFDCSGFVRYVFLQHAVDLPRTVLEQFHVGRDVAIEGVSAGDLIFFTTVTAGASHVGIALDASTFVHAPGSGSVVRIERLDAPYWRARLVGVKRLLALSVSG
jgi:cell wall-associated NlpC family hydrolase